MIKNQELLDSITRVKENTKEKAVNTVVVRFSSKGVSDQDKKKILDEVDACAVEIQGGKNKYYKAKVNRKGELFDPSKVGMLYNLNVIDRVTNEIMFKFREVNKKAFDTYIAFLETGKESLLFAAEREALHG